MRILAIRGRNLASLARTFAVELASGELAGVGLFAITGPVGAGKSTLLDAMCLALFDRTPRLSGRGGTPIGEDGQDPGDWLRANDPRTLLRRDAVGGHAEVDFVGRDGVAYRAHWSVRRARRQPDGRLQDQELVLSDLRRDVVVASGRRTEVLAAIQQRLGLDFAQFCRSVLLAQGEFHAFLHARADERAKLLETLTGASVYRRLSRAAHERRRSGEQQVELLRGQFDNCEVLLPEARKALAAERSRLSAQLEVCDVGIKLAQRYVLWHESAEQHRQTESEATVALRQAQAASDAAEARRRQLQLQMRAMQAIPRWEVAQQARAGRREFETQLATKRRGYEAAQQRATAIGSDLQLQLAQAFGGEVAAVPAIVRELPHWQASLERWQQSERSATSVARQLPALLAEVEKAARRVTELRGKSGELEAARNRADAALVEAEQAAATYDFEQFAELRKRLAAEQRELQAIREAVAAWGQAERTAADAEEKLLALTAEQRWRQQALPAVRQRVTEANEAIATARAQLRAAEQHHGLSALRSQLVDGAPCPLCGAAEHPAAGGAVVDLEAMRGTLAAAERELDAAQRASATARAEQQRLHREVTAATATSKVAEVSKREQHQRAGLDHDTSAAAAELVEERQLRLDAEDRALGEAEAMAALRAKALRSAGLTHKQCERAQREHEALLAAAEQEHRATLEAARAMQQQAERLVAVLEELRYGLAPACDGLPDGLQAIEAMRGSRLERLQDLHRRACEHVAALARASESATEAAAAVTQAETARAEVERAERALATALSVSGVAEDDVAVAFRLGPEALAEQADSLQQLVDAVTRCRTVLQERTAQRREHERHPRPTLDADDALRALHDAQQERMRVEEQHVEARARLSVDDQMLRHRAELLPRLERAEQELGVWRTLAELIGSSQGDAFAVFAQGLTLDQLLLEANRRLEELARRYRLEKIAGAGLDFVVVDLDMGGTRRSLHTLSGGETFLVSLALALALATLAAPRSRVETLFLDEGFGTLDAHNLEIAIGALDSLQATGCQVGVISHVDGFAERIGAVVEVRPEGSGQSRVVVRV